MPVDWTKLGDTLADDAQFQLGEDQVLSGAELKAFLNSTKAERDGFTAREKSLADQNAALKKYQDDTSALFSEAATLARREMDPNQRQQQQPGPGQGLARNLAPADRFEEEYGNDQLFGPFAKRFEERIGKTVQENILKPFIEQQLAPELKRRDDTIQLVTGLLLQEKGRNDFRDIPEWPENTTLDSVRKYGTEHGYFVKGGEQFGVLDYARINQEMMGPIRQERAIKEAESRGEENAALRLRQNAQIIQMPNRNAGGAAKGPSRRASGSADAVIDAALGEAAQDRETMKLLGQLAGR